MNLIPSVNNNLMETFSSFLKNGCASGSKWAGRSLTFFQAHMKQNQGVAVAMFVVANSIFMIAMNALANVMDKHLNQKTKSNQNRSILVNCSVGYSAYVFNMMLSKIGEYRLSEAMLTAIAATTVVLRLLNRYRLSNTEQKKKNDAHKNSQVDKLVQNPGKNNTNDQTRQVLPMQQKCEAEEIKEELALVSKTTRAPSIPEPIGDTNHMVSQIHEPITDLQVKLPAAKKVAHPQYLETLIKTQRSKILVQPLIKKLVESTEPPTDEEADNALSIAVVHPKNIIGYDQEDNLESDFPESDQSDQGTSFLTFFSKGSSAENITEEDLENQRLAAMRNAFENIDLEEEARISDDDRFKELESDEEEKPKQGSKAIEVGA